MTYGLGESSRLLHRSLRPLRPLSAPSPDVLRPRQGIRVFAAGIPPCSCFATESQPLPAGRTARALSSEWKGESHLTYSSPIPPRHVRRYGTAGRTPAHTLPKEISQRLKLPQFRAPTSDLKLLRTPAAFYDEVKTLIENANERIFISSLYIGKDETELIDCIRRAVKKRPSLKVFFLVDALRSTREGPFDESKGNASCASLLASLVRDFPDQVDVRMYRTPGLPLWMERLIGKRLVEGAGLQHMKVYGADDDVIVSGANLSNDYFTNRQDRYVHIRRHTALSNYLHSLLLLTAQFSYNLVAVPNPGSDNVHHCRYVLLWDQGSNLLLAEDVDGSICETGSFGVRGEHRQHEFAESAGAALREFTERWRQHTQETEALAGSAGQEEAVIVPLLQMGPMKVEQETSAMPLIFDFIQKQGQAKSRQHPPALIDFTSGYFSLLPAYKGLILNSSSESATARIITAAPISNGFYGSKGISRHLPPAYTWLQKKFYEAVKECGKEDFIEIREWQKPGWTYHAKGVWYTAPCDASPTLTLIGSSNFGSRSALRDLECTLLISVPPETTNRAQAGEKEPPSLGASLQEEITSLREHATDKVDDGLFARAERQVHWGVKVAAEIIKGRL